MSNTPNDCNTLAADSRQVWDILTQFVKSRRDPSVSWTMKHHFNDRMTYAELSVLMGRPGHNRVWNRQLGFIARYCAAKGLPALNALVVRKDSKLPGDDVILNGHPTAPEEIKAVLDQDWSCVVPPTQVEFEAICIKWRDSGH